MRSLRLVPGGGQHLRVANGANARHGGAAEARLDAHQPEGHLRVDVLLHRCAVDLFGELLAHGVRAMALAEALHHAGAFAFERLHAPRRSRQGAVSVRHRCRGFGQPGRHSRRDQATPQDHDAARRHECR